MDNEAVDPLPVPGVELIAHRALPAGEEGDAVPQIPQKGVSPVGLSLSQGLGKGFLRPEERLCLRTGPGGLKRRSALPFPKEGEKAKTLRRQGSEIPGAVPTPEDQCPIRHQRRNMASPKEKKRYFSRTASS